MYNSLATMCLQFKNKADNSHLKIVHACFKLRRVMQNPVTPRYTLMLIFPLHCFLSVESGCSGGAEGRNRGAGEG